MKGLHVKGEGRREKGELTATGLEGRVIVITGVARGIGRAVAERLLAAGARVVLSDSMLAVNLNGTILGSQAAW